MLSESNGLFLIGIAFVCIVFAVYSYVRINVSQDMVEKNVCELKKMLKDEKAWMKVLNDHDKVFEQYDRFLKWNSMLDTSYRTNDMVCAFRYKGERKIEFCRYNPQNHSLPLEMYDYPGTCAINERMFDAWLPCIGGVAPVGENTIPQTPYGEEYWTETPEHKPCSG